MQRDYLKLSGRSQLGWGFDLGWAENYWQVGQPNLEGRKTCGTARNLKSSLNWSSKNLLWRIKTSSRYRQCWLKCRHWWSWQRGWSLSRWKVGHKFSWRPGIRRWGSVWRNWKRWYWWWGSYWNWNCGGGWRPLFGYCRIPSAKNLGAWKRIGDCAKQGKHYNKGWWWERRSRWWKCRWD